MFWRLWYSVDKASSGAGLRYIGAGMVVQILLTVGMWLACRKYHPSFGIPGTELRGSFEEQLIELGRGWEWWPTVLWQAIWTWMVVVSRSLPTPKTSRTLYLTNNSSLPATPMWLLATYVQAFFPVNQYFDPSKWLHLADMCFEVFVIFIPCYLVIRQKQLRRMAIDTNAKLDLTSTSSITQSAYSPHWKGADDAWPITELDISDQDSDTHLLTISALESFLQRDPSTLQEFSAKKEFSGENIAFLTRVSVWKSGWPDVPNEHEIRGLFSQASEIYFDLVSQKKAQFPVNLSWQDLEDLESIFEPSTSVPKSAGNNTANAPYESDESPLRAGNLFSRGNESSASSIELGELSRPAEYITTIPQSFKRTVFDKAHRNIKYLVFTNTWPKFVGQIKQQDKKAADMEHAEPGTVTYTAPTQTTTSVPTLADPT
ncbi:hypothetical protein JX265_012425 [Neoarthrinium moseri]|uniref:RGS domain-containing protein n=1 Tax=Neoarthrinium moseri TaxID=1658444 RepID=A0A9P9WAW0_9PEZI|nr:hypothetical protein JX265_012425 [Neoarthrinium moseri]